MAESGREPGGRLVICETQNVEATVLAGAYRVARIAHGHITSHMWSLTEALIFGHSPYLALVREASSGLTLVLEESLSRWIPADDPAVQVSGPWRAVSIYLGPAACDEPGVVCFLSQLMARRGISMLNFSTYDCDTFLVRESSIGLAVAVLREHLASGVHGLIRRMQNTIASSPASRPAALPGAALGDLSWLERRDANKDHERYLAPATTDVRLAKLLLEGEDCFSLGQCTHPIIKLLFYTPDWPVSRFCSVVVDSTHGTSLLLDAHSLELFPKEMVSASPERWAAIALRGAPVPLDQIGIVNEMTHPVTEAGISILNVSNYWHNYTFVRQDQRGKALRAVTSQSVYSLKDWEEETAQEPEVSVCNGPRLGDDWVDSSVAWEKVRY